MFGVEKISLLSKKYLQYSICYMVVNFFPMLLLFILLLMPGTKKARSFSFYEEVKMLWEFLGYFQDYCGTRKHPLN